MFCRKCGKEIPDDSKFCMYCGENFEVAFNIPQQETIMGQPDAVQINASVPVVPAPATQPVPPVKKHKKLKIALIIIAVIVVIAIAGIYYISTHSMLTVDDVKNGYLYSHGDKTIGNALDNYFDNCKWEAFVADSEKTIDVVEFIGYDVSNKEFRMQFIHEYGNDKLESDEFVIYGCWIDGEALTDEEQNEVLESIYKGEDWHPEEEEYIEVSDDSVEEKQEEEKTVVTEQKDSKDARTVKEEY